MSDELNIDSTGHAMIVRFTRPEIRNPLSVTVLNQLHSVIDDVVSRPEIEATGSDSVAPYGV